MNKRIDPRIFHKNTAEDYLQAAIETANWIDTLAVKTEHGRIWKAKYCRSFAIETAGGLTRQG